MGSVQISRAVDLSGTLVEPSVQLVGMSAQGVLPQFGLGARRELEGGWAAFSRLNFSRRFPSLMDRYYVAAPFFTGNPGLRPEKATTFSLGSELKTRNLELSFQAYGQLRTDAQITTGVSSPFNAGEARVGALIQNASYTLTEGWTVLQGFTVTGSRLEATGREFPYMPSLLGQAGIQWSDTSGRGRWAADTFLRMEGARQTTGGQNLGGFAVWDLGARYRLVDATSRNDLQSLELIARIENIADRIYESVQDYPNAGRIISVAVVGEF
jgi:outer membrane cobalamin receptor